MNGTCEPWRLENGWLDAARSVPSPNFNPRPPGMQVGLIVIHNISLPPGEFGGDHIEALFLNCLDPGHHPYFADIAHLEVSAHFLIRRDGEVVQFVSTDDRAWHAGQSHWCGLDNCNDFSVGIELEGTDDTPYSNEQYDSLERLVRALREQYPDIAPDAMVGHCDIAPDRKTDPGPAFDWRRLMSVLDDR